MPPLARLSIETRSLPSCNTWPVAVCKRTTIELTFEAAHDPPPPTIEILPLICRNAMLSLPVVAVTLRTPDLSVARMLPARFSGSAIERRAGGSGLNLVAQAGEEYVAVVRELQMVVACAAPDLHGSLEDHVAAVGQTVERDEIVAAGVETDEDCFNTCRRPGAGHAFDRDVAAVLAKVDEVVGGRPGDIQHARGIERSEDAGRHDLARLQGLVLQAAGPPAFFGIWFRQVETPREE